MYIFVACNTITITAYIVCCKFVSSAHFSAAAVLRKKGTFIGKIFRGIEYVRLKKYLKVYTYRLKKALITLYEYREGGEDITSEPPSRC